MADDLVLDAPVLDNEPDEQIQDEPIEVESAEDRPEDETATEPVEAAGDGRTLPQWIRDLKESHPAAYKEAKGIFFGKKSIDDKLKDFDLDGTKGWLDEVGGKDAIVAKLAEHETKAAELDGINEAIASGNPELIKEIAEAHPEAFAGLAQAALSEWQQRDPESWEHAMSGIMAATISQSGIPMFLERMGLMLEYGKTEEVQAAVKQLKDWAGSFSARAAAAPVAKANPKTTQIDQREQALQQREQQAFRQEWDKKVESVRKPLIEAELKQFVSRRPNDADAKQLAEDRVWSEVDKAVAADEKLQKDVSALLARRDIDGAARIIKSREAKLIQEIAPKVGRTIFGAPAEKKAAATKPAITTQRKPAPVPGKPKDKFAEIFASA